MFSEIPTIVRDYLATVAEYEDVTVDVGPGAREAQDNYPAEGSNRIVFTTVPNMGFGQPQFIGEEITGDGDEEPYEYKPRQLGTVVYRFDVSISGFDLNEPENDLAHQQVCFDIWELAVQALQSGYAGQHEWVDPRWTADRKYQRHGAELVVGLTLNIPFSAAKSRHVTPVGRPKAPKPGFEELE